MEIPPKILLFRSVDDLIQELSKTEIDNFRPWRFDGYRWISFSDYFYFGTETTRNLKNNIAFYISSAVETYVEDLKLILNIYNENEKLNAINQFIRTALKTYSLLELDPPQKLLTSILKGAEVIYEDDCHITKINVVQAHIPSWRIIIETK